VVIGLPEKLFYGTGIPAAVLVFRKNKADDKVLFIDASRDFEAGKNQNVLREADLQRILDHRRHGRAWTSTPTRHACRDCRERLQPQHPALRGHL
jgi:type I restriction-modification system DNA methylase subunit